MTDHANIEIVLCFEVRDKICQGDIAYVHIKAIPGSPVPFFALEDSHGFRRGSWFAESHKGNGKIDKSVFVRIEF